MVLGFFWALFRLVCCARLAVVAGVWCCLGVLVPVSWGVPSGLWLVGVGGVVGLRCDSLVLSCWPPIVLLLWLGWGLGGSWVSWGLGCGGLGLRWVGLRLA